MFEQAFKNIDDVLWKEAGCTTELDYTEQTSWLLFLKYLDDLEIDKATEAALEGRNYVHILDPPYRWDRWAAPKTPNGNLDHNRALTGDDLRDFVDRKLFPYLHGFKQRAASSATIEYNKPGQEHNAPSPNRDRNTMHRPIRGREPALNPKYRPRRADSPPVWASASPREGNLASNDMLSLVAGDLNEKGHCVPVPVHHPSTRTPASSRFCAISRRYVDLSESVKKTF